MNDAMLQSYISAKEPELCARTLDVKKLGQFDLDSTDSSDLTDWHRLLDVVLSFDFGDDFITEELLQPAADDSHIREHYENMVTFLKLFIKGKFSSYHLFTERSKWYISRDSACGHVWKTNYVAFRCRTCGFTPCMSVCSDCFYENGHEGHDYSVFLSQAGGACDCGLDTVMNSSGFCKKHKTNRNTQITAPRDFLSPLEHTVKRVVHRICVCCRLWAKAGGYRPDAPELKLFAFLADIVELSGDCRQLVANILLDPACIQYNQKLAFTESTTVDSFDFEDDDELTTSQIFVKSSEKELQKMQNGHLAIYREMFPEMVPEMDSFFDELFEWMIQLQFPMELVMLFLNTMTVDNFKKKLAKTLIRFYPLIAYQLKAASDSEVRILNERIVHLTVQLFCNEELVNELVEEGHILPVFMSSFKTIFGTEIIHVGNSLFSRRKHPQYWAVSSDFGNVMLHREAARSLTHDPMVFESWVEIMYAWNRSMCVERCVVEHVIHDDVQLFFQIMRSMKEIFFFSIGSVLKVFESDSEGGTACSRSVGDVDKAAVLSECLEVLEDRLLRWVDSNRDLQEDRNKINICLPLHRYYALFLAHGVTQNLVDIEDVLLALDESQLQSIMHAPLKLLIQTREVTNNMWLRNGQMLSFAAAFYRHINQLDFSIDPDLYLVQACLSHVYSPGSTIVQHLFGLCYTGIPSISPNCMSLVDDLGMEEAAKSRHMGLFQDLLEILAMILSFPKYIAKDFGKLERTRLELITALASAKNGRATYSWLVENVPTTADTTLEGYPENVALLKEAMEGVVQPYKKDGDPLAQLQYELTDHGWSQFCSVFVIYRSSTQNPHGQSFDNFVEHFSQGSMLKQDEKAEILPSTVLIRPLRDEYSELLNVLHNPSMHRVVFLILFKYHNGHNCSSEMTLFYAIWLLEQGLATYTTIEPSDNPTSPAAQKSLDFEWFKSNDILHNAKQIIGQTQPDRKRHNPLLVNESIISLLLKIYASRATHPKHNLTSSELSQLPFPYDYKTNTIHRFPFENKNEIWQFSIGHRIFKILTAMAMLYQKRGNILAEMTDDESFIAVAGVIFEGICPVKRVDSPMSVASSGYNTSNTVKSASSREAKKAKARRLHEKRMNKLKKRHAKIIEAAEAALGVESGQHSAKVEGLPYQNPGELSCAICSGTDHWQNKDLRLLGQVCRIDTNANLARRTVSSFRAINPEANDLDHNSPLASFGSECAEKTYVTMLEHMRRSTAVPMRELTQTLPFDQYISHTISTCGHYLHISCYRHYLAALKKDKYLDNPDPDSMPIAGEEFECPVCRQSSNLLLLNYDTIPLKHNFTYTKTADSNGEEKMKPVPLDSIYRQISNTTHTVLFNHGFMPNDNADLDVVHTEVNSYSISFMNEAMLNVKPRFNATLFPSLGHHDGLFSPESNEKVSVEKLRWLYARDKNETRKLNRTKSVDEYERMLKRLLSASIEVELSNCNNGLITMGKSARTVREIPLRSIVHTLVHVLADLRQSIVLHDGPRSEYAFSSENLQSRLYPIYGTEIRANDSCPALLLEPSQAIISLAVVLFPLDERVFLELVGHILAVTYCQILVLIISRMGKDERSFWRMQVASQRISGSAGDTQFDLAQMIQHITRRFDRIGLAKLCFATREYDSKHAGDYRQKDSVEAVCKMKMLPFLQTATMLFQALYNKPKLAVLDYSTKDIEFDMLVKYLKLAPENNKNFSAGRCVRWPRQTDDTQTTDISSIARSARDRIDFWLEHLGSKLRDNCYGVLERLHLSFSPGKLVKPPKDYIKMYVKWMSHAKAVDDFTVPSICLCCGDTILSRVHGIAEDGAMTKHALVCNFGSIVYLDVESTECRIIRGKHISAWGTLYLDNHGEADINLTRGKPLHLQEDRFKLLEKQWFSHTFDSVCTTWIQHRDRF